MGCGKITRLRGSRGVGEHSREEEEPGLASSDRANSSALRFLVRWLRQERHREGEGLVDASPSGGHPKRGVEANMNAGLAFAVGLCLPPVNARAWFHRGLQSG